MKGGEGEAGSGSAVRAGVWATDCSIVGVAVGSSFATSEEGSGSAVGARDWAARGVESCSKNLYHFIY